MAKILSSNRTVGRPGFRNFIAGVVRGKSSVKRLHVNDPANGIFGPGGDAWSETEDIVGNSTPTIISGSQRAMTGPSSRGKTSVRDRSVNRKIDKR